MWNGKKLSERKEGVSTFYHMAFSHVSDPREAGRDWYNFGCIENIPDCLKYIFPESDIEFRLPPGSQSMEQVDIDIWDVIRVVHFEDRFHLNPARWDHVKQDLSEGWCYSPWVTIDEIAGKPKLMDGRHRMVALLKFTGHKRIPFIVDSEEVEFVKTFFSGDR